jgi:hypothetical protein
MTPSHSRKQGLRYRYYVASALIHGQPELVGSVTRVPAAEIESLVSAGVGQHFATEEAAARPRTRENPYRAGGHHRDHNQGHGPSNPEVQPEQLGWAARA